jgi:hypothetical protein
MQMSSVDRPTILRPAAEVASPTVHRVNPVPPVNPPVQASSSTTPAPSVINLVKPVLQVAEGEPVYAKVKDPSHAKVEDITAPKDWTIHRPAPEKVENPPPKPLAQVLMDHLRTVWSASASAIQIEQIKNQLEQPRPVQPSSAPGNLAKEVLTYEPAKIKKSEKI